MLVFEALVFDVGGVIIPHDNEQLYRRLAGDCLTPNALEWIRSECHDVRYGTGTRQISFLHEKLRRTVGYRLEWDGFLTAWCSHLALDIGMLNLIQELALKNRILLFSNTNSEHWEHIQTLTNGLLNRFEAYLSYEIGCVKPSLESFQLVARTAKINPARSLFVDDLVQNVRAAREAGFEAEIFVGQSALEHYSQML